MKRSKRYDETSKGLDNKGEFGLVEATQLVRELSNGKGKVKFDESVELAINLNLRAKHTVRGTLTLPHQSAKSQESKNILVFAKGSKAEEAEKAGASYVGDQDLIDKIKGGWVGFDVAIATPDMMKEVGKLGPILGRRGLMPNPKTGTVTMNLKSAIQEFKEGKTEYKADKTGIIHLKIGTVSMENSKLADNAKSLYKEVLKKKPADLKGEYIKSISMSSTMGPGVKLLHSSLV